MSTSWTPERESVLTRYWNLGYFARRISEIINEKFGAKYSRNAVIGKAHRIGLRQHVGYCGPIADTEPRREAPEPTETVLRECQWPIGDPGTAGFHFCGDSAVIGKPYCVHHCAVAYRPAKSKDD